VSSPDRATAERNVLMTVALGTMLAPLNSTMIVVALPAILHEFGQSVAWGAWIVVAYLVTMAAGQSLGGSLGDHYGQRRMFQFGLSVYLIVSALAALAPTLAVLIVARTFQASAGALVIPNGMALVRSHVADERQGAAFGRVGAGIAVAACLGTPLGGILTDILSWHWMFATNIVLVVPALVLSIRLPTEQTTVQDGCFDLSGAALLTTSLITLVLSLTVWRVALLPIALAPLCGLTMIFTSALLWRHVSDRPASVVQLSLFRQPGFLPASLVALLSNLTMYTVLVSLPVLLIERGGWSSSATGMLLATMSLQMIVFVPLGGWLADRRGWRYPATLGSMLLTVGSLSLVSIDSGWDWAIYLFPLVAIGAGVGLSSAPTQALAVNIAPSNVTGQAAGLFSTMTYLGSILGSTGIAAILGDGTPNIGNFRVLYVAVLIAAILGVLAAVQLPARPSPRVGEQMDQAATPDLTPSSG
jgi:MFS family permease